MFNSFILSIILNVPSFFSLRKTVETNWSGSCELSIKTLFKQNCHLWSNIEGLHKWNNGPYQKISFITTNCCQYSVIWCKCFLVINKVFNIACYKSFTTFIIFLFSLSWQEFSCACLFTWCKFLLCFLFLNINIFCVI